MDIAALFVETGGCYFGLPSVDPWDESRDARSYPGAAPVVAHPPCQRWGRFWHGSTRKPHQFSLGDDGGCFASALASVRKWGGVLEHPCDSHAWKHHGLTPPKRFHGWAQAGDGLGWTCYVEHARPMLSGWTPEQAADKWNRRTTSPADLGARGEES